MRKNKKTSSNKSVQFMTVHELFKTSWNLLKTNLKGFSILFLLFFGVFSIVSIFIGISTLILVFWEPLIGIVLLGTGILGSVVLLFVSQAYLSIAIVLMLDDTKPFHLSNTLKKSTPMLGVYILFQFLNAFLILGGVALFIIPAILIAFFTHFAFYEIILGRTKKITVALANSASMVSQHFKHVLARTLVLIFCLYLLVFGLSTILGNGIIPSAIMWIIMILFGWFAVGYRYTLYKEVSGAYDKKKPYSIRWIYTVSIVGWIVAILEIILIVFILIRASGFIFDHIQHELQQELRQNNKNIQPFDSEGEFEFNFDEELFDEFNIDIPPVNDKPQKLTFHYCESSPDSSSPFVC